MNKEIKEALGEIKQYLSIDLGGGFSMCALCEYRGLTGFMESLEHEELCPIATINTALEEYGKPKTVTREFLDNTLDLVSGCAAFGGGVHLDAFEEGLISLLENEDIEVEGDK